MATPAEQPRDTPASRGQDHPRAPHDPELSGERADPASPTEPHQPPQAGARADANPNAQAGPHAEAEQRSGPTDVNEADVNERDRPAEQRQLGESGAPSQPDHTGQTGTYGYPGYPGYPGHASHQSYPTHDAGYPAGISYPNYPRGPSGYPAFPPPNDPPPAGYPTYSPGGYPSYPGGPAAPDDPLVPADFGGWFRRAVEVARRSFRPLALLQLLNVVVLGIIAAIGVLSGLGANRRGGRFGSFDFEFVPAPGTTPPAAPALLAGYAVLIVVGAFVACASIYVAIREAAGHQTSAGAGLRFATGRWLAFIGWVLVACLVLVVPIVLAGIWAALVHAVFGSGFGDALAVLGMFGALVAVIYLGVAVFMPLYGVVVVERAGIGRCFVLIRGRWWATLGRLLVASLLAFAYYVIAAIVASAISIAANPAIGAIVLLLLGIPVGVFFVAVVVVTYSELRAQEAPGVSAAQLDAQLVARPR